MSSIPRPRVSIISKLTIVPSTPVKPGRSYPLSILDHTMSLHTLHIVFYYPHYRLDDSFDLGRLREALSEVLSYFPPVTGRMVRNECGNWVVKCNDAGVRMSKAKVDCSLDDWLRFGDENHLTAWEDLPEDTQFWSPFQIQMTDFAEGGLAIGLSCPHMHADPACATLLMKAWTDFYRGNCIMHPPFFHPPAFHGRADPNTNMESVKHYEAKSGMDPPEPVKMSTATFRFSDSVVKKCLFEIQSKCATAIPFDMLAALFWSSVTKAKKPNTQETCSLSICIDFRKRMHAPLPHGFYGNALHFSTVSAEQSQMVEGRLDYVTQVVHDHLSTTVEEEYWSVVDWLESKKDVGGRYTPPFRMYGPELTCANMEHVPAFSVALDDMKPVHVSYHIGNVEGDGLIMVLPSPEEGLGRTVMVTLPEDQMKELCKDPAILCLEPTLLVSPKLDEFFVENGIHN